MRVTGVDATTCSPYALFGMPRLQHLFEILETPGPIWTSRLTNDYNRTDERRIVAGREGGKGGEGAVGTERGGMKGLMTVRTCSQCVHNEHTHTHTHNYVV